MPLGKGRKIYAPGLIGPALLGPLGMTGATGATFLNPESCFPEEDLRVTGVLEIDPFSIRFSSWASLTRPEGFLAIRPVVRVEIWSEERIQCFEYCGEFVTSGSPAIPIRVESEIERSLTKYLDEETREPIIGSNDLFWPEFWPKTRKEFGRARKSALRHCVTALASVLVNDIDFDDAATAWREAEVRHVMDQ